MSFVGQINKFGFKLVKALGLVYIYFFVFIFGFIYIIKINKIFTEIIDYLGNRFKRIGNIGLISSIQVMLYVSVNSVKDIIYTSIFICKVVGINLEFINNLNIPVIVGWTSTVAKLYWIGNLSGADLTIFIDFLFD